MSHQQTCTGELFIRLLDAQPKNFGIAPTSPIGVYHVTFNDIFKSIWFRVRSKPCKTSRFARQPRY